jgi:hypothetical protein
MSLIFTKRERRQARAYRGMIKRARVRAKVGGAVGSSHLRAFQGPGERQGA